LTASASLTKPDSNPTNNQDSVSVTSWATCGSPFGNSTSGDCTPLEFVGSEATPIFVNSTFVAECCVSAAHLLRKEKFTECF
jgi:hypothetical protein